MPLEKQETKQLQFSSGLLQGMSEENIDSHKHREHLQHVLNPVPADSICMWRLLLESCIMCRKVAWSKKLGKKMSEKLLQF